MQTLKTISFSLLILLIISCGSHKRVKSGSPEKLILGEWKIENIQLDEDIDNNLALLKEFTDGLTFHFKPDGVLTGTVEFFGMSKELNGEYRLKGDELTLTVDGKSEPSKLVSISEKEMIIEALPDEDEEFRIVFKRKP